MQLRSRWPLLYLPRPAVSSHRMHLFCSYAFAEGLEDGQWQRRRHKTNVELQQRSLLRFAQLAVTFIGRVEV